VLHSGRLQPNPEKNLPGTNTLACFAAVAIEIGLEHTPFVVLVNFFSSFEHAKNLLIMAPNNIKNCSLKCDFLIFNYE
jgi:hypothetical protein